MRRKIGFLLFTVLLVRCGLFAPAALAADDDGMGPLKEQAGTEAAATRATDTRPLVARYLVTFMKSRTAEPLRTATVVSVTNQANGTCEIVVEWFRGFETAPVCTTTFDLDAGFQADVCSRALPAPLTTCNTTCDPELTFHEGKAVVSSRSGKECSRLGVSARVYYTREDDDSEVSSISDSNIVLFGQGNRGD